MTRYYKTRRWELLRAAILKRDGYICQESKRYGRRVSADTVHHVFPRDAFPEYQWEPWNLVSLSAGVHDQMHDRNTGALTDRGVALLRRVAARFGKAIPPQCDDRPRHGKNIAMKTVEKILVCGFPGTGKTTWAREHLGNGIAYDLDAIAGAFRLRGPHEEYHDASRRMANDLLFGFIQNAGEYSDKVIIIRTAPQIDELDGIAPTRVVVRMKQYVQRPEGGGTTARLQGVVQWCDAHGVPVLYA